MNLSDTFQLLASPEYRIPVLVGAAAISLLSLLAIYVVGARLLITGLALAQVAGFGAAAGRWIPLPPLVLAMGLTGCTAAATPWLRVAGLPADASLLLLFLLAAVGAQLSAAVSGSGESQVVELINGQLLIATPADLWTCLGVGILVASAWMWLGDRWLVRFTMGAYARQMGLPALQLESLGLLVLGLSIGATLPALGVLLTIASCTCPGLAALALAPNLRSLPFFAFGCGWTGYAGGMLLAFATDWPPGPTIAGVLVVLTLGALSARRWLAGADR